MAEDENRRLPWAWLAAGFLAGLIVATLALALARQTRPAAIVIQPPPPTPLPTPPPTPAPLRVYVTGAVLSPAVYALPPGSIVQDAIEQAGGFSQGADTTLVNLAQPLLDGMQITVPEQGLPVPATAQPVVVEPTPPVVVTTQDAPPGGKVNINVADLAALDGLPGIGPSTAQKIIDYRVQHGPFATPEDIMNVAGIGPAKFEQIKQLITVGE